MTVSACPRTNFALGRRGKIKIYSGVFIDIDDTLLDYEKCSRNALEQACFRCSVFFSEEIVALFRAIDGELWQKQRQGLLTIEEVVKMRAELFLDRLGKVEKSKDFKEWFQQGLSTEAIQVSGADEILRYLSLKVPLYAASNGMKNIQLRRLNQANLLKYFTDVFVSDDIGAEKPNISFFHECLRRSKLNSRQTLMVGDSLEADMFGAANAGMDTCWFNPARKDNSTHIKLQYVITDLRELQGII